MGRETKRNETKRVETKERTREAGGNEERVREGAGFEVGYRRMAGGPCGGNGWEFPAFVRGRLGARARGVAGRWVRIINPPAASAQAPAPAPERAPSATRRAADVCHGLRRCA